MLQPVYTFPFLARSAAHGKMRIRHIGVFARGKGGADKRPAVNLHGVPPPPRYSSTVPSATSIIWVKLV